MTILICDICGTSYPDTEEKCPTCGNSRAFEAVPETAAEVPVAREKVRGGRFSKKNVRKRMKMQEEAAARVEPAATAPEMAAELSAIVESVAAEVRETPAPVPDETPAKPLPESNDGEAQSQAALEEQMAALFPQEAEPEAAEPEPEVPAQPEEEETPVVPLILFPEEPETVTPEPEEAPEEIPEEAPVPVVIDLDQAVTEDPAGEPEGPDEEEKKKKKALLAAYRRDVGLNLLLFFSVAVFLASSVYLMLNYGIPYLKDFEWPTFAVVQTEATTQPSTEAPTDAPTDVPTDPPTEPPTEPPTDPPTEPPTEPPTDPPTDPPTEAPTEPLLDVKLELNYYDLTFGAVTHVTQLKANVIPNEDITWISDDPSVVTVSDTGLITAVGHGRTTVRAIYGDQEVTVKINCPF